MKIHPIEAIKEQLLAGRAGKQNFPATVHFPFDSLYMEIVTQIRTTELSSECILFGSAEACNTTKEFSGGDARAGNFPAGKIKAFWVFGQNGQGDLWLFGTDNSVRFYDHNLGEINTAGLQDMGINFGQWLQFAFLNKQLDELYAIHKEISPEARTYYKKQLENISKKLLENYPFTD